MLCWTCLQTRADRTAPVILGRCGQRHERRDTPGMLSSAIRRRSRSARRGRLFVNLSRKVRNRVSSDPQAAGCQGFQSGEAWLAGLAFSCPGPLSLFPLNNSVGANSFVMDGDYSRV